MSTFTIQINGQKQNVNADGNTPLLWILREHLGLMGTKFGCGLGQCGACTVHLDGTAIRACVIPLAAVANGQKITTIEGLSEDASHPLQKAWVDVQVPQCGYCQSGQIMQAAALLSTNPSPTREEIIQNMNGNLCRCGTQMRIIKAIQNAAKEI